MNEQKQEGIVPGRLPLATNDRSFHLEPPLGRAFREMWPLGLVFALAAAAGWWWTPWAGVPLTVLAVFHFSFFRDPERSIPADVSAIVAPADGRVTDIKEISEDWFLKRETRRVGIFLSIFDVHVNRAPIGGEVKYSQHFPGKFFDARNPACSAVNESQVIGIADGDYEVTVKLITGAIARRILPWCAPGDHLEKGARIGMIRYGSRAELFLPLDARVAVKIGDKVKGGETVLAYRK